MKKPAIDIDKALEDFDLEGTEKSLAEQYEKLFGCPCEVQIHASLATVKMTSASGSESNILSGFWTSYLFPA